VNIDESFESLDLRLKYPLKKNKIITTNVIYSTNHMNFQGAASRME
jgi:hypothetical protein